MTGVLLRADTVKAAGIIRPLRIAEISRIGCKCVGFNRLPIGIGNIRTGINHHCLPAGPVDIKTELICLHAEAAIGRLCLWQPKRNRNAGIRSKAAPTCSSRQIIRGHIVIVEEIIQIRARSVAIKKDARACFQNQKMNRFEVAKSMMGVLFYENNTAVSCIGSALGADKKINLEGRIYVIVHVAQAAWPSGQGRPADVRGDGLYLAGGLSMAGSAGNLWAVEFSIYPMAALVSGWTVGRVAGGAGAEGPRQVAISGYQPRQSASGCEQPRWRPTKSSHWAHQGRSEYQGQCLGGQSWASRELESSSGTACRCKRRAISGPPQVAWHDYRGRQGLRQRRIPGAVAALGEPFLYPATLQPTQTCRLASRSLQETAQGGKLIPTVETLSQNWDTL